MKSAKHIELSRKALTWLKTKATKRGVRGCEEVILKEGYVADAAAICGLQIRFGKELLKNHYTERSLHRESDDHSWVFETKVSRADFRSTFIAGNHIGDRLIPVANFHYVVTSKGLVVPEEVPTFWGLLEESGVGLAVRKEPEFIPTEDAELFRFAYKVLRSGHDRKFTLEENENMLWP